jgi:alkanesulfonate monooxygenase
MQLTTRDLTIPVFTMFAFNAKDLKSAHLQAEKFIVQSEHYKYTGILVPDANANYLNSWFFANLIIKNSNSLTPFIAVNPTYTHPFFTAKYISNLSLYLKRPLHINYITGTALFDASSLGDVCNHDSRYDRLGEYCTIVNMLLEGSAPCSFKGSFYTLNNVALPEPLSPNLFPVTYIAGKSDASLRLVREAGARRLSMAMPLPEFEQCDFDYKLGFHFGIIARANQEDALAILSDFAPQNNTARKIKEFTTGKSQVAWKKELVTLARSTKADDIYNLMPFINGHSDVPYLAGSIQDVAKYIFSYLNKGLSTLVIEVPMTGHNELHYINQVLLSVQNLLVPDKK